jgi:flagella basal body P-ring formation protein FlgA
VNLLQSSHFRCAVVLCTLLMLAGAARANGRATAAGDEHEATLRSQVSVTHAIVTVGDVASITGTGAADAARLSALVLTSAPRVGMVSELSRAQVLAVLPKGWRVGGYALVRIERATQDITSERLCGVSLPAARARLESAASAARSMLACLEPPRAAVHVASGTIALRTVAEALPLTDGQHVLPVEVWVDDSLERTINVPLHVQMTLMRWCATSPVGRGDELEPAAFTPCARPVRHPEELALADAALPKGRARRMLRPGDVLAMADVAPTGELLAGDAVTVHLRNGSFELESPGILVQSGSIGSRVRVRTGKDVAPMVGKLNEQRVVELE